MVMTGGWFMTCFYPHDLGLTEPLGLGLTVLSMVIIIQSEPEPFWGTP